MNKNPAEKIIEKCGGPEVLSGWCSVELPTVYRWTYEEGKGTGGIIPNKHIPVIIEKAKEEQGLDISYSEFFIASENGVSSD